MDNIDVKNSGHFPLNVYTVLRAVLLLGLVVTLSHCGGGLAPPGGNDVGVEIVEGEIAVNPIFVRTGVSSNTIINGDIMSTVYVGRRFYQEVDSEFNFSFNPSKNFLTLGDESGE